VATILIADDNSNIQKMVALAFKDEGIAVVAVGNGEAAVRKAPELMPDLILADIFMPVRSGYEVCEFIKQNTKLAHVPVILLAGAFDPFDEKEAQRVGADGVLKKPFVPPDPMVNLVKELLAKSVAMHLVPVSVAAEAPASESPAPPAAAPEPIAPREISSAPTAFDLPTETGPEEVRPFKAFAFREEAGHSANEGGSSAFASLMDSGLGHRVEFPEKQSAPPISEENETEKLPAKEFSGFSSWLSKTPALDSVAPPPQPTQEETPSPLFSPSADRIPHAWEVQSPSETRPEDETIVESMDRFAATHLTADFPIYRDEPSKDEPEPTNSAALEEEPVADGTAEDSDWVEMGAETTHADAAPVTDPEVAAESTVAESHIEAQVEARAEEHVDASAETQSEPMTAFRSPFLMDDTQTIDAIRSSAMPWHSVPSAIRDTREELEKPSAESAERLPTGATNSTPNGADATDFDAPVYEAMGEEQKGLDAYSAPEVRQLHGLAPANMAQSFPVPLAPPLDARQIEEIVSRVVERMQPQVLEVITREILRPVVEALVRRQLELK
jgi:CheY-like chemotaxis protein